MSDSNNGRTHAPSLGEITAEIDGIVALMNERDRRYDERFMSQQKAVEAALASSDKMTSAVFAASEKAVAKAEAAQADYNMRSNEFRGQLDDQAKTLMPRAECSVRFDAVDKDIQSLLESRSLGAGRDQQSTANIDNTKWIIGTAITIAGLLVSMGLVVAFR